jgi:hypothetical protein
MLSIEMLNSGNFHQNEMGGRSEYVICRNSVITIQLEILLDGDTDDDKIHISRGKHRLEISVKTISNQIQYHQSEDEL